MTERQDRRLKARLRFARLRHQAIIEDVDYRAPRGLDRTLFQKVAQGDWIDVRRSFCPLSMILPTALAMAPPTAAEREP